MKKVLEDRIEYYNELGQFHRENDLPAIEYFDGDKSWWQNGLLHRLDGPAIEWNNGHKCWYQNGKRHRYNGPAIEDNDGYEEWYYQGEKIECSSTEEFIRLIKLRAFW